MKYKRVIFVSMDNTCLGPAAESIFNRIAGDREIEAISRGMVVLFPEPMNAKMVSIMKEHGFGLQKEFSEPLTEEDITEDTLLLAMCDQDVILVREMFPEAKVYKFRNFVGEKGDVEVPLGGSLADYEVCYEHIDLLTKMAAEILFREDDNDSIRQ